MRKASYGIQEVNMDPNISNQGAVPPPETQTETGQQTQYFPPQGESKPEVPTPAVPQETAYGYAPPPTSSAPVYPYPPVNQQGQMSPPYRHHTAPNERDRTWLAFILIGGGLLFLLDQFRVFAFRGFGDLVLLVIGGVFMYAYVNTRPGYRVGFLIPGAILLGIGMGEVLTDLP